MRIKRLAAILSLVLVLTAFWTAPGKISAGAASEGRGECVVEVSSRRFLHEKNADVPLPMASTTKILTADIIISDCDPDEIVTVPKEAEGVEGSSVYLKAGEQYTVRELLYGLMLRSGNDCATALAIHHSGSVERFAEVMTARAVYMGAEHSAFSNPHGLPAEGHYTTARDLSLISAHAMGQELFREIVSCKFYEPRGWKNKNKMLFEYDGATGVKTGFTTLAGRCLVTACEREGMELVSVVLNCADMFERSKELLDAAYAEYNMIPVVDPSMPFEGFAIEYAFRYPLKKTELRALSFRTNLCDPLPEKSGEVAGQMEIYLQNDLIFSQNLYII